MAKYFVEIPRVAAPYRPIDERVHDYNEVESPLAPEALAQQAKRCLNCGVPFCHGAGCPLHNRIPDFNAAICAGKLHEAWEILSETSSFPEFTSRVCPALCEGSCTLGGAEFESVSIRQIEKLIVENAYVTGWVKPLPMPAETAPHIAIIGSGPAGLSATHELVKAGFKVTVYEQHHTPGGLLRYGIPHFKLDKAIIDRRIALLEAAGVRFITDAEIGTAISATYLYLRYAGIVIATGTPTPRDLKIDHRDAAGIHFALDFLRPQNAVCAGELARNPIDVTGKRVLIIGGGDTGSDCVGTAIRNGASSVTQIEIMPEPPATRSPSTLWPAWPYQQRTSSSQKEGCTRRFALASDTFEVDAAGHVTGVKVHTVKWSFSPLGKPLNFEAVPGSEEILKADVILLAMGFLKQDRAQTLARFGLPESERILIVGDATNGPSLVVRAIAHAKAEISSWASCIKK